MKRHTITLGASTSAGGQVIAASSMGDVNGVKIALEGDAVFCPACKSTGKICCVGPRIPELWNGKQVALEDDLCVCGCSNPPRLKPIQTMRFQNSQGAETKQSSKTAAGPHDINVAASANFNEKFVLFDEASDRVLSHTEYAIRRENGQIEFGTTDASGRTHLLATTAEAESVDIYT